MNPEKFNVLRELTEDAVLAVMQSPKPKADDIKKAEMGLRYIKAVTSTELQRLSTVVQVAGLYSSTKREEIAEKIIAPMYNIIDSDIQVIHGSELRQLIESKSKVEQEKTELQESKQKLENQVADLRDEQQNNEKQLFTDIAHSEYQQKRELLK